MSRTSVSIILPTFNESGNIVELIRDVMSSIPAEWAYEILIMDDNSPDGTYEIVRKAFEGNPNVLPVLRTMDRGFAKSIRAGIEMARSEHIVIMDSDYTHDPIEIPRLLHVGKVYDLVSGSRFCAGGRMVDTTHYVISMAYNWLLRLLIRTQVQDNLGGYYTVRRKELLALPLDEIFFGYGDYYFRLLHFAQRAGLVIVEVPAEYLLRKQGKSKSNWIRMMVTYTFGAIRLKWRTMRLNKYKRLDET
jgi:dolichol-phosphate mannosyltransferase